MRIVESFCEGRNSAQDNEDVLVTSPHAVAVLDGVSASLDDNLIDGKTVGYTAANAVADIIKNLSPQDTSVSFVAKATSALASIRVAKSLPDTSRLSTTCVLYHEPSREIWRIADSAFGFVYADGTWELHAESKDLDRILLDFRALAIDFDIDTFRRNNQREPNHADLAQIHQNVQAILDIFLRRQMTMANRDDIRLGYGVLSGKAIPPQFVEVTKVPQDVKKIILCSDGFPVPRPTLADSLAAIDHLKQEDPLTIGLNRYNFKGFKGFLAPDGSIRKLFDDAGYLSVEI